MPSLKEAVARIRERERLGLDEPSRWRDLRDKYWYYDYPPDLEGTCGCGRIWLFYEWKRRGGCVCDCTSLAFPNDLRVYLKPKYNRCYFKVGQGWQPEYTGEHGR